MSRFRRIRAILPTTFLLALLLVLAAVGGYAQGSPLAHLEGSLKSLVAASAGPMTPMSAELSSLRPQGVGLMPLVAPNGVADVVITFGSPAQASAAAVAGTGATVQLVYGRYVKAYVPLGSLGAVSALPGVVMVGLPEKPYFFQGFGATLSEGVQLTNALQFQYNGLEGAGVRVAVLDGGFIGYQAAEINQTLVQTASFPSTLAVAANVNHGTAVAEVVQDMAPGAGLTLIRFSDKVSAMAALDYIVAQRIPIVNMSFGFLTGPFNGRGDFAKAVNTARTGTFPVLSTVSSGNAAKWHWEGDFHDTNSDTFNEFQNGSNKIPLTCVAGEAFEAYLSWFETTEDETAKTSQDYDLILTDATGAQVASSAFTQDGTTPPREALLAFIPTTGLYNLQIKKININAAQVDHFQLFVGNHDLPTGIVVTKGSLSEPADAQYAFTVGATRGANIPAALAASLGVPVIPIDTIEDFSSRGPSAGGFAKPDLVAPDGVSTSVAGLTTFFGTSASAPHVAGAAALLLAENSTRTIPMVEQEIRSTAKALPVPPAASDPNSYGGGRLQLRINADVTPPTIVINYPHNSDTINSTKPLIMAQITDANTGVKASSIVLKIDGTSIPAETPVGAGNGFAFDATTGSLTYPVATALSAAVHTITLDATDNAGNVGKEATVYFRVTLPHLNEGLQLISIPYTNLVSTDPVDVFGLPTSQFRLLRWNPLDPSVITKFHVYPDAEASFVPPSATGTNPIVALPPAGLGYFVSLNAGVNINAQGTTLSDQPSYSIRMPVGSAPYQGWQMIGNPYLAPVDWGGAQFETNGVRQDVADAITSGVTDGVLFEFVSTGADGFYTFSSNPLSATMQPWKGYWVHVKKDTKLILFSPGSFGASAHPQTVATKTAQPTQDNWMLRLGASVGSSQDPANIIGVSTAASSGYTPGQDVAKPPPLSETCRAYVACRDLGAQSGTYARRMLPPGAASNEWSFEVASSLSRADASLTWPELNQTVPAGVRLILRDVDTGREVYMRTVSVYPFQTTDGGGVRHFKIIASTDSVSTLAFSGVTTQAVRGAGVALTYVLSAPAQVTVEIRNISGVPVKRFAESQVSGTTVQSVLWNGLSDRGTRTPSGRYLARITARAENGQTVQAIRPFELAN